MKERFCGRVKIELEPTGISDGNLVFKGRAIVDDTDPDFPEDDDILVWEFDDVRVKKLGDPEKEYDVAAAGVVHYATLYTDSYEGPIPGWAPSTEYCNRAVSAIFVDDRGYCIRREIDGPTTYSG